MAAEHGHESNVEVLVESGANLTLRDHLGLTPLDLAEKVREGIQSLPSNFFFYISISFILFVLLFNLKIVSLLNFRTIKS